MVNKRTATRLLLGLAALVLLAARAAAQVPAHSNLNYQTPNPTYENGSAKYSDSVPGPFANILPFGPHDVEMTADPFGPAETSGYGNGPRAKIGWFASYERLLWSLAKPAFAWVGSETAPEPFIGTTVPDGPTVDNSFIRATAAWGNRWELGYVDDDDYGWLVSVLDHVSQGQYKLVVSPQIRFNDPNFILDGFVSPVVVPGVGTVTVDVGTLPTAFKDLALKNVLVLNGLELTRFYRAPRLHEGGYFELLYGTRWLQINDTFIAEGRGNGAVAQASSISLGGPSTPFTFPLNILDGSIWSMRTLNNIIGPQIGFRWFRQRGRWVTTVEGRFLAGANFQDAHMTTNLGDHTILNQALTESNLTTAFRGIGSNFHQFGTTFSPVGELRVNGTYQLTSNFSLKVGYTGLVVGNISRASNRIDYTGPNLISILNGGTHQSFFANGLSFGVEFNR